MHRPLVALLTSCLTESTNIWGDLRGSDVDSAKLGGPVASQGVHCRFGDDETCTRLIDGEHLDARGPGGVRRLVREREVPTCATAGRSESLYREGGADAGEAGQGAQRR